MTFHPLYVIATRVYSGRSYRTRYYRWLADGRIIVGAKRQAVRFPEFEAERVVAHLRGIAPVTPFWYMDDRIAPPRGRLAFPQPRAPKQTIIAPLDELA